MRLIETEHSLVTPVFVGTEKERIEGLSYWTSLISVIRSLNVFVSSHENKLAILAQLKQEINLIDSEVNNITSTVVTNTDGSTELTAIPDGNLEKPSTENNKSYVDLSEPETLDTRDPNSVISKRFVGPVFAPCPQLEAFKLHPLSMIDQLRSNAGV